MRLTRCTLASGLVTLLILGCAAGPNSGGPARETAATSAERGRPIRWCTSTWSARTTTPTRAS
jgi:hypothetical protein